MRCITEDKPVCGNDGVEYPNECFATCTGVDFTTGRCSRDETGGSGSKGGDDGEGCRGGHSKGNDGRVNGKGGCGGGGDDGAGGDKGRGDGDGCICTLQYEPVGVGRMEKCHGGRHAAGTVGKGRYPGRS
mgnify:CR=1 FL=1